MLQQMGKGGLLRNETSKWLISFYAGKHGGNALRAEIDALKIELQLFWNMNIK